MVLAQFFSSEGKCQYEHDFADFDYMIKKASGDSDAKMPENSFLKRGVYPWTSGGSGFGGGGGGVF